MLHFQNFKRNFKNVLPLLKLIALQKLKVNNVMVYLQINFVGAKVK